MKRKKKYVKEKKSNQKEICKWKEIEIMNQIEQKMN